MKLHVCSLFIFQTYEAKSDKEKEKYEVAIAEYKQNLIDNPPADE